MKRLHLVMCAIGLEFIAFGGWYVARSAPAKPTLSKLPWQTVLGTDKLPDHLTLVEFGDYQCPPCRASAPKVALLEQTSQRPLVVMFRNYPLEMHIHARELAELAETAKLHRDTDIHMRFMTQEINPAMLAVYQESIGTPDPQAVAIVDRDVFDANQLGIKSTPTFLAVDEAGKVYVLPDPDSVNLIP